MLKFMYIHCNKTWRTGQISWELKRLHMLNHVYGACCDPVFQFQQRFYLARNENVLKMEMNRIATTLFASFTWNASNVFTPTNRSLLTLICFACLTYDRICQFFSHVCARQTLFASFLLVWMCANVCVGSGNFKLKTFE